MIKVLKPASIGPLVTQWQTFLRGQGHSLDVTGSFDSATVEATKTFQTKNRLEVDGLVGNQTLGKAAMLGFEVVDFTESDPAFPKLPDFPRSPAWPSGKRYWGR